MKRNGWIGFIILLCCGISVYADSPDLITQGNSNADRIATQAQSNMTQQQQILAQRLQALSAAMQAQNPQAPIVVQPAPSVSGQTQGSAPTPTPAPATPPVATTQPAPATTENNATGLKQNNNSRNQWDYGF